MNRFARHALILSALFAASATAQAAELTVVLHDVRAQTGLIKVALVDSQAGWDGQAAPVQATGAPPSGGQATFVFKDLKPGAYAVLAARVGDCCKEA